MPSEQEQVGQRRRSAYIGLGIAWCNAEGAEVNGSTRKCC
jgi:hypothetical protein